MHKPTVQENTTPREGLVVAYFGSSVAVEAEDGQVFPCHLRRNQTLPVVGDRVLWQMEDQEAGTIVEIKPRRSMLARGNFRNQAPGKSKIIAANIDYVVLVMAPPPVFSAYLLDRYIVAAEILQLKPVIVLNKQDLLDANGQKAVKTVLDPYRDIPYPVFLSSIYLPNGMAEISDFLKDKTAVLVGPSGVGKSSLIAKMAPEETIRVGEVSMKGAGKHTTTATRLYHLPCGGYLIDSPGVREFNLWDVSREEVRQGFIEFSPYMGQCKFRDCQHIIEPGCAVRDAVSKGKINENRYHSFQQLIKDHP